MGTCTRHTYIVTTIYIFSALLLTTHISALFGYSSYSTHVRCGRVVGSHEIEIKIEWRRGSAWSWLMLMSCQGVHGVASIRSSTAARSYAAVHDTAVSRFDTQKYCAPRTVLYCSVAASRYKRCHPRPPVCVLSSVDSGLP